MSLKNDIEREFGVPIRLRAGAPGALNVFVNGEQIYSKKKTGRLPTSDELIRLIRPKFPGDKDRFENPDSPTVKPKG